jgi:predicted thioredoxin/glutaredoxin
MPDLAVEEVEFTSPVGTRLAVENGILYPPAVFVNGQLIAKGKIDADALVTTVRKMNGAHE